MFGHVEETPYDLQFSVFRIPVRVHPGFWLMGLMTAGRFEQLDLVIVWIACLFVSILVHELGHALVAKSYGWPVKISLYWMGGLAISEPYRGNTRGRSMWMSFAGPLAGFGLFGLVVAGTIGLMIAANGSREIAILLQPGTALDHAIGYMEWINLYWGLINLLPVLPLDGGRICSEFLHVRTSVQGQRRTFQIGMIVGALVALMFFKVEQFYAALFFGSLAVWNYQNLEQTKRGFY